jgi:hypothetical protein
LSDPDNSTRGFGSGQGTRVGIDANYGGVRVRREASLHLGGESVGEGGSGEFRSAAQVIGEDDNH